MQSQFELYVKMQKQGTPQETVKERFEEAAKKTEATPTSVNWQTPVKTVVAGSAAVAISNVGTFTGSPAVQNAVNNATKVAAIGIGAVVNPLMTAITVTLAAVNNAIKINHQTKMWALEEQKMSNRIGDILEKRGRV